MKIGFWTSGSMVSAQGLTSSSLGLVKGSFLRNGALLFVLLFAGAAFAAPPVQYIDGRQAYPLSPEDDMTSGELCNQPSEYRYPERIAYCDRDVHTSLKREIIAEYDQVKGYRIGRMDRRDFKIDHLIPLCMGGSNGKSNLWPQHRSVYEITDSLEFELCQKMASGRLAQRQAVEIILRAKKNLDDVPTIRSQLGAL